MLNFWRLFLLLWSVSCGLATVQAEVLTLGVIAVRSKADEQARWQPLADYLTNALQVQKVELRILNFAEMEQQLQNYELDFLITSPSYYVRLHENNALVTAVASLVESNQGKPVSAFGGVIFCLRERSDINSLQDLKNKKIAIVNHLSFGGYQMQSYELAQLGIKLQPSQLIETRQPQDNVVNTVLAGQADVGFVRTDVLESMAKEHKLNLSQLKILNLQDLPSYPFLLSTRLYPEWSFVALPNVDHRLARKVTASLLLLEPEHPAILAAGLYGFTVPVDYSPVEALLRELRLPPFDTIPNFTLADVWLRYRQPLLVLLTTGVAIIFLLVLLLLKNRQLYSAQQQIYETEQRFKQLVNRMTIPLACSNKQNQIIYFNQRFFKVFGYSQQEIPTVASWMELAYPDVNYRQQVIETWSNAVQQAVQSGQDIQPFEYNVTCKNGDVRIMEISGVILGDDLLATFIDLTKRKQAEKAVAESESKYRTLFETANDGIFLQNAIGFLDCNQRGANMYGLAKEQLIGKSPINFCPKYQPDGRLSSEVVAEKIEAALRGETPCFEWQSLRGDGVPFDVEITLNRIEYLGQSCLQAIVRDIGKRKQAETELKKYHDHLEQLVEERTAQLLKAKEAAEAANIAKSTFIATMSHELRTPLNAILGFSELMSLDETATPSQKNTLAIINRSGVHLLGMINDVLEISKIEAGYLELDIHACDLLKLLQDISDMFSIRATNKQLSFSMEIAPDIPQYIKADSGKLSQILINLLGNALKFTKRGGVILRTYSEPLPTDSIMLTIEIIDTGIGIPASKQEALFKPFVQLTRLNLDVEGSGLGLAISKSLIELMGGQIGFNSVLDVGSTFRITVPVAIAGVSDIVVTEATCLVKHIALNQPVWRLLVVDDNADNRLLLVNMLNRVGFDVLTAENGLEAINAFEQWHPHLIWMDMRMPIMDGYQATAKIRQLEGGDMVKIIAISASAFKEQHESMMKAGCDAVLHKPIKSGEVFGILTNCLGVKFIYQDNDLPMPSSLPELTADMLGSLTLELRQQLHEAALNLDIEETALLIAKIRQIAPDVASGLQILAQNYHFEQIIELTKHR